jgi:hypothetical protein
MNLKKFFQSVFGIKPEEPPKRFLPGQEITPKEMTLWYDTETESFVRGPKFGEVVRVIRYSKPEGPHNTINITGYAGDFAEYFFDPIINNSQLEELLEDVCIPETIVPTKLNFNPY